MKRNLLGTTALAGALALTGGATLAAEAPEWSLGGNMNFQAYWIDQDYLAFSTNTNLSGTLQVTAAIAFTNTVPALQHQDHAWYFGVDEAELQIDVDGTADNGLKYGFKIELQANTTDSAVADEARIQLSGSWGTLQLGDEDGAEDTMNYGGENLMGATGGFDGDFDDGLVRFIVVLDGVAAFLTAPSYPTIAGDSGDNTKVTYYSPRFSGFQFGASVTPTKNNGDAFKRDKGLTEDHYGIGANYDNSFGDLRLRASAVYSRASSRDTRFEDVSAWSLGGILGWGAFSLAGNYTDNGESLAILSAGVPTWETSYWNVAAGFETGSLYLSAGYFSSVKEFTVAPQDDSTFENIALTADYSVAPGLGVYAEIDLIEDDILGADCGPNWCDNSATIIIMGANVSF